MNDSFLFCSDLHLGLRSSLGKRLSNGFSSREVDFLKSFDQPIEYAIKIDWNRS